MQRERKRNFIPSAKSACLKILDMPDCVALSDRGDCRWLKLTYCQGSKCSFMQSKEDTRSSLQRWKHRLSSLEKSEQVRIAAKYYRGMIPWQK